MKNIEINITEFLVSPGSDELVQQIKNRVKNILDQYVHCGEIKGFINEVFFHPEYQEINTFIKIINWNLPNTDKYQLVYI